MKESKYKIVNEIVESLEKEPERWHFNGTYLKRDDYLTLVFLFGFKMNITSNTHGRIKIDNQSKKLLKEALKTWKYNLSLEDFANCWQNKRNITVTKELMDKNK